MPQGVRVAIQVPACTTLSEPAIIHTTVPFQVSPVGRPTALHAICGAAGADGGDLGCGHRRV
jgi:hypothetical protein